MFASNSEHVLVKIRQNVSNVALCNCVLVWGVSPAQRCGQQRSSAILIFHEIQNSKYNLQVSLPQTQIKLWFRCKLPLMFVHKMVIMLCCAVSWTRSILANSQWIMQLGTVSVLTEHLVVVALGNLIQDPHSWSLQQSSNIGSIYYYWYSGRKSVNITCLPVSSLQL